MQPTRIHRGQAAVALVCALLFGPATANASDDLRAAGEAARRYVDPVVNGAVGDVIRMPSGGLRLDAAAAARQDSDPDLNGSLADSPSPKAAVAGSADLAGAWDTYHRSHWQAAYGAFAAAADAGVPEAARMALAMAKHGSRLYRQVFVISAAQRGSWQRLGRLAASSAANAPSARGGMQ